jgi:peroxiredoxin
MDLGFEVSELPPADALGEGETAPDFTRPLVNDEFWEDVALSDLTDDSPVVLVFHQMAGDFPPTYIFQRIRDDEWTDWDAEIVGVSISSPYELKGFIREWRDFEQFRFFSDPAAGVAEEFGIATDVDGMSGIREPRPAVFVLDEDRTVRYAWVAGENPEFPPYSEVEAAVQDL